MKPQDPAGFDKLASIFADYGTSVRGFVRYKVTQKNLEPFLGKKPLKVLDVGGGSGPDAAWLAQKGHTVTLLEPSQEQREYAQRRFNFFLSTEGRERITIVPGVLEDYKHERFDAVLIHGVAMYQKDPAAFIALAIDMVSPGGLISIVEKGYYGAEARAIREQDLKALRSLRETQHSTNHINQNVRSFKPEELQEIIEAADAELLQWTGVRVVTDEVYVGLATVSATMVREIVDIEYEHGRNPSIRGQGQLLHFIARKR